MDNKYSVGDNVVTDKDTIGVVKRVTPTGRVVVSFMNGRYEQTFRPDGWEVGNDSVYYKSRIEPLTEERYEEIYKKHMIQKCRRMFDKAKLTPEQAKKIMEILEDKDD